MKLRNILCNQGDFTSLKEIVSLKSKSDAYVSSISNYLVEIATTCKNKNKIFPIDILIIEDNINFIFKYFKAFHKIAPTLKVIACTKTNATEITINYLAEDISQIKMVVFDYNLEEFPKDESLEAKQAEKRYDFIRRKLLHEYKFYAVSAFKKKLPYASLQKKFTIDKVEYFQKSEANLEYLLSELYDNAEDYFFPGVTINNDTSKESIHYNPKKESEFEKGDIDRGKEFLVSLNRGVSDILMKHSELNDLENLTKQEQEKRQSLFNTNLHKYVLKTDKVSYYKSYSSLSGEIKHKMNILNHIIENELISLEEIQDLREVVIGQIQFRRRSRVPFSISN